MGVHRNEGRSLLARNTFIAASLASRYPLIICDEHQDADADQHAIIMSLHAAGARLRVFGDPMQQIYGARAKARDIEAASKRWTDLVEAACEFEELDHPHRWDTGEPELGQWILEARNELKAGNQIDLSRNLPRGLTVHVAENNSRTAQGFGTDRNSSPPIYGRIKLDQVLVLTGTNDTCTSLRAFFGRRVPIWEGHVRDHLAALIISAKDHTGDPGKLAEATLKFLMNVGGGFTPSGPGKTFIADAQNGCKTRRRGMPEYVQSMAREIVDQPNHKGIALALGRLRDVKASGASFADVHIHHARELSEAIHLGSYDDPDDGFAEIARRRTHARPKLPDRAISTIHKAKGLEFDNVMVLPCDRSAFGDTPAARAKLYVAMSRAKRTLMLVVSNTKPSPLFRL